jgi:hypothetical protein
VSGLLFALVDSVRWLVTLPSWLVSTDFGTCLYQCYLCNFSPVFLRMLKRSWPHSLYHVFLCIFFLPVLVVYAGTIWTNFSSAFSLCNIFIAWCLVCNAWFYSIITMIILIILLLVFRKLLEQYRRFVLKNNSDIRDGLSCLNHVHRVSSVLDLASAVNSFCISKQWHLMLLDPFGSMVYTITNVLYILVHAVGKPGSGI